MFAVLVLVVITIFFSRDNYASLICVRARIASPSHDNPSAGQENPKWAIFVGWEKQQIS